MRSSICSPFQFAVRSLHAGQLVASSAISLAVDFAEASTAATRDHARRLDHLHRLGELLGPDDLGRHARQRGVAAPCHCVLTVRRGRTVTSTSWPGFVSPSASMKPVGVVDLDFVNPGDDVAGFDAGASAGVPSADDAYQAAAARGHRSAQDSPKIADAARLKLQVSRPVQLDALQRRAAVGQCGHHAVGAVGIGRAESRSTALRHVSGSAWRGLFFG